MGIALRRAMSTTDADASYRSAVGLIRRLEALSGKLSGGLDAVGIAEQVMDEADSVVPDAQRRGLRPLAQRLDGAAAVLRRHPSRRHGLGRGALAAKCWEYEAMVLRETRVAIPLRRERRDDRGAGPRDARPRRVRGRRSAAGPPRPARGAAAGGPAVRARPRHRHERGAPADRPRGARRRRPGRRVARLPRRQPRRRHLGPGPAGQDRAAAQRGHPGGHRAAALHLRPAPRARGRVRARGEPLGVRQPGQHHLADGGARHARRAGSAAPGGRGVRAAAHRPGGDGQRPQALRGGQPVAALHDPAALRRDRGRATTAPTRTPRAATPRACKIMRERSRASAPSSSSPNPRPSFRAPRSRCASAHPPASAPVSLRTEAGSRHPGCP